MSKIQVNKLYSLTGHNDAIYALAEWEGSQYFYTGAADGMVVEWDLLDPKHGKLIAKLPNSIYALAVDNERGWLFIGHNQEGIHVIDLVTKKEIWSLKITQAAIFDIKILDKNLFVGTGDGVVTIVDVEQIAIKKHLKLSDKSVRVIAIHPEKKELAIGLSDYTVKIFSLNDYTPKYNLEAHINSVFALAYAPDGKFLISGGRDAHLKIWNTSDYKLEESIAAHLFAINYLSFRSDGRFFATCSMDKSIKLWDAITFRLLKVIDKSRHAGHGTSINKLIWSKYNEQIIAVSDDRTISIWDLDLEFD